MYKKLDQISLLYNNIDFLLCTETWLNGKYPDGLLQLPGMKFYRNDRCQADERLLDEQTIPRRGGGVAIYVKNSWAPFVSIYKPGTTITVDYETLSLQIDKPGYRKTFICVTYKPPKGNIENCISYFQELFVDRNISRREKWILGDFNVNLELRNEPNAMLVNRFLRDNGLKQLINVHTRLTHNGGSCLDWIITDCPYTSQSGILEELLSDHFSIYVIRKKEREKVCKVWKTIRIQKNFDKQVFCNLLLNHDWTLYYTLRDVDLLWNVIYTKIIEILEIMCPYKRVCLRDPKTPWINADVIKAFNERKKYMRIYWKSKNQFIWDICKYLRNRCNSLVRGAKALYIKNSLRRNADDPKKFWKLINNLLKGPKKEIVVHEFIDPANGDIIRQDDICDFLNNYYVTIGRARADIATPRPIWDLGDDGYNFEHVSLKEVSDLIKGIDVYKDSCIEGISSFILKEGFGSLPKQLQYLFNVSFEESVVPREWAKGYINILPKGGNLKDPSNWRPITQTLLPAKLLEKLVQKRFFKILSDFNVLSPLQYGFLPGRSTQLAIFDILKDLYEAINSKLDTGLVFLDVQKAFDSLDHNMLLLKLQTLGVSGKMLQWFYSYLDRTQRVRHHGKTSSEKNFICGIPQGSCFGPTLFIFYINDVFTRIDNDIKMMMFADDCVLYKSDICADRVLRCLQDGLDNYVDWGIENNMYLNVNKTKTMLVHSTNKHNLYRPLVTGGKNIQFVTTFNYLGVLIDKQLSFTPYYNLVKRKMENKIFVMSKIRKYIDNRTTLLIYKQAVLPLVEYAGFVLVSCTIGQRYELQVLQNNALRLSKRYYLLDRIRIDQLHSECRILGLEQRRRQQLLRLMYLHSRDDSNIKKPVRVTRAMRKLTFKTATRCTQKYQNSPFYKGTVLWDNIDIDLQHAYNVLLFQKGLKKMYTAYREIW